MSEVDKKDGAKVGQSPTAGAPFETLMPAANRRTVIKGAAATGLIAGMPTYLRGFTSAARAQDSGPVKLGFIEDESGNLAVYGLQKLHAAQLAVKEINDGKTLKGAPNIG